MSQRPAARPTAASTPLLTLTPGAEAPRASRRFVREQLALLGRDDLIEAASIGISELVTNSCLHARTALTVRVAVDGTAVRLEVTDGSPVLPAPRNNQTTATTGRGLQLVSAFGSWGVHLDDEGKTVWFEPKPSGDAF